MDSLADVLENKDVKFQKLANAYTTAEKRRKGLKKTIFLLLPLLVVSLSLNLVQHFDLFKRGITGKVGGNEGEQINQSTSNSSKTHTPTAKEEIMPATSSPAQKSTKQNENKEVATDKSEVSGKDKTQSDGTNIKENKSLDVNIAQNIKPTSANETPPPSDSNATKTGDKHSNVEGSSEKKQQDGVKNPEINPPKTATTDDRQ